MTTRYKRVVGGWAVTARGRGGGHAAGAPHLAGRSARVLAEALGRELAAADLREVVDDALEVARREGGLPREQLREGGHRAAVRVDRAAVEARRLHDGEQPALHGAGARLDEDAHRLDQVAQLVGRARAAQADEALAHQVGAARVHAVRRRLAMRARVLRARHEEAEEGERGARVLELLVAHARDGRVEERGHRGEVEQQRGVAHERAVAHLEEGGEQLRLRLGVGRAADERADRLDEPAGHVRERVG
eukprot:CAMPEP_0118837812 /NCGR_PEP_ID=MMETSP1162-20130426/63919_1 /TAXON_ID=33656 /ORGANISM="Phaeocystis Sp, Strain CCMP2710" /LENGTH=247 /DNA_ID=CAMNT_0006769715 /DNA_START=45 /DNA_END=785 /DNA_ORIENTATION=+